MTTRRLRRASREMGFTLLELIVAASILALIAVFSWRGLDALIRQRDALAASQATIDTMQRAFARIERDALVASDVQLDGAGTMRLSAGTASVEGTPAATVEYRFADGTLTRVLVGADAAPLTIVDGLASLALEAWAPKTGGGGWVRTKGAALEAPPPAPVPAAGQSRPGVGTSTGPTPQTTAAGPIATPGMPQPNAAPPPQGPPVAAVQAATGIRLTFVRGDGTQVVRAFVVGGA